MRVSKQVRFLCVLRLAVGSIGQLTSAQTQADLGSQTDARLTSAGAVGTVYSVKDETGLARRNDASAWHCLEFLQLPASPYLWADRSSPVTGRRFCRAVEFAASTNAVFIPPGTFRMGSPESEVDRVGTKGLQTALTVGGRLWMGKYEAPQNQQVTLNPTCLRLCTLGEPRGWRSGYGGFSSLTTLDDLGFVDMQT